MMTGDIALMQGEQLLGKGIQGVAEYADEWLNTVGKPVHLRASTYVTLGVGGGALVAAAMGKTLKPDVRVGLAIVGTNVLTKLVDYAMEYVEGMGTAGVAAAPRGQVRAPVRMPRLPQPPADHDVAGL